MRDLTETINHMLLDGFDYLDAAAMVASWHIAELVLGPEEDGTMDANRDDIECQIQAILHEVYGRPDGAN